MKIAISVGHGEKIRGASGPQPWGLDEVDECKRMVPAVADYLRDLGHEVVTFFDTVSTSQSENLNRIVNWHNAQTRNLDVSFHANAYVPTEGGRGCEVLYVSQQALATKLSAAIAAASGLINRGAHARHDLFFLNSTHEPAVLLETFFVDAHADCQAFLGHFYDICRAIANVAGPVTATELRAQGKISWFGGWDDLGVSADEGLAFISSADQKPQIFLPPDKYDAEFGLARNLNTDGSYYIAMRWDYTQFSKEFLRGPVFAKVTAQKTNKTVYCTPADWGPATATDRVCDCSRLALTTLGIATDDVVTITFPVAVPVG